MIGTENMKTVEELAQAAHRAYCDVAFVRAAELPHRATVEQLWIEAPPWMKEGWIAAVQEIRSQIAEVH
jgi:hypothetical protein